MAIIHKAALTPTKLELLTAWLPGRAWLPGGSAADVTRVAGCRFDDPDGEVGVEMMVLRTGDALVHLPLTYRGAPLENAEHWLIGTTEHSVLGTRWVYDAVGDPVYLTALAATIRSGGRQADEMVQTDRGEQRRDSDMQVRGTGSGPAGEPAGAPVRIEDGDPAVVVTDGARLTVRRVLTAHPADEELALTGTWAGTIDPVALATLY